jgi:putative ABC transport system substrate-binding protein
MTDHQFPRRTVIGAGLGLGAGLMSGVTQAQAEPRPPVQLASVRGTIGFLNSMTEADFDKLGFWDAFKRGLIAVTGSTVVKDQGTADVVVTRGFAGGIYDNLGSLVEPWFTTASKNLVVATGGVPSAKAAVDKRPTSSTIPILYMTGRDPVNDGLHTAANAQGLNLSTSNLTADEIPNLLRDLLKRRTKSYLFSYNTAKSPVSKSETDNWDKRRKWGNKQADHSNILTNFQAALADARGTQHNALIISADPYFTSQGASLVKAAGTQIPVFYPFREYVEAGGLISYGPNLKAAYRWLGMWAGMVLSDAKNIDDLPPFPLSHELVINVNDDHKAANVFPIPDTLLQRATDIVDVKIPT